MFDELEPLGGHNRGLVADLAQVVEDLVVRCAVRVAAQRGVPTDRAQRLATGGDLNGAFAEVARGGRVAIGRRSGPFEQLDEQLRAIGGW